MLAVCTNLNLHIPEDVMIVGVDNDEQICEQSDPTISSVCPDFERSGHLCAELLNARIRNPRLRPRRLTYGIVGLIRRGSSVPALKSNYRVMAAVRDVRTRACAGLRVADVVATMGCSTRLAEMRFREVTGKTIREAIADIRMERAVVLLKRHPDGARRGSPQGRRHAHRRHRPGVRLRHGGRAAHRVPEALRTVHARLARN